MSESRPDPLAHRDDSPRMASAPFPVVGIGASAGGLRALQQLFANLKTDTGMAFVVIVHLDPHHESHMAELIQQHTAMPVAQVTRPTRLEPGHVYIIPPDRDLSLDDGYVVLSERRASARNRAPIDLFFRTLAETRGPDAIGIILSGTGSDGTQGIKWIHEQGGFTMVQAPVDAEYDAMPTSALATDQVDISLPASELGARISELRLAQVEEPRGESASLDSAESGTLARILTHVRVATGHDFAGYKPATLLRRIQRRVQLAGLRSIGEYLDLVQGSASDTRALFNDLLVVVTTFFRDPEAIAALERDVVPQLFAGKGPDDVVRVWVAGCATGEEAYSLAMLLSEFRDTMNEPPGIQIFATDVQEHAFATARQGLYPESIEADVSPARLDRFFLREPGGYRIKKFLREAVLFASHNLLRDPPFLRLELVSCRNVLIYLRRDAQHRVIGAFHFALRPHGYLFLGTSETPEGISPLFASRDRQHRIFQAVDEAPQRAAVSPLRLIDDYPALRRVSSALRSTTPIAAIHQQLIEAQGPPSLVVTSDEDVVHLSKHVGRFLERGGGEPTHKLLDMVTGDLKLELRELLRTAFRTQAPVTIRGVTAVVDGAPRSIDVTVRPLETDTLGDGTAAALALVVFDEASGALPQLGATDRPPTQFGPGRNTEQLEEELRLTKARLRTFAAEYDATTEALRASNEELQSITEEQRAVTEELETSQEELQSMNEELRTINQEHRVRNEELGEVNADLLNLIDSTAIGTIFLDGDLRIRRYTPLVADIFSVVLTDRGRPLADITHRLAYDALESDARRVFQTLVPTEREVVARDGRWFTVRVTPYRTAEHRIGGVVLTFVDTTDRKHIEQERETILRKLGEANTVKSNFIGVMSHEFRTPLNAILGYSDILDAGADGPLTDDQRAHIRRIISNARHLSRMVEDILASGRLESGGEVPRWNQVDIDSLVREVAASIEPLVTAKRLSLRIESPVAPLPTLTDGTKVRQILFNLLGNAVRFTDAGGITLRVLVDERTIDLEVEDSGIGIAAEHLDRVFERFWQADQSTTRIRGGTGLGLMVCRSLAESLNATISVESELGRGSVFRVRLPKP